MSSLGSLANVSPSIKVCQGRHAGHDCRGYFIPSLHGECVKWLAPTLLLTDHGTQPLSMHRTGFAWHQMQWCVASIKTMPQQASGLAIRSNISSVLPMLVVIGWMGLVMLYGGLKYTPLTATLGALVLGVGSEYAILMMERFYEELENVGNPYDAMKITANRIGSALVALPLDAHTNRTGTLPNVGSFCLALMMACFITLSTISPPLFFSATMQSALCLW